MSPPSRPDPALPEPDDDADAIDKLAAELLGDPELYDEPTSDVVPGGGLTWIRSTLRAGGDADDPLVGSLFHDKYRILRKIGAGGFGAVYEALDERGAHNRVALKIMLPSVLQDEAPLEVFRGEAVRVTRLNHPNIVDWKNFDRTPDGSYYFVMELLEGEDLQTVLKREGALEWRRALRILQQILGALRAAHFVGEGQSILHLDLKPKNILLLPERRSRPETAKVIDFGIGQYLGGEELAPVSDTDAPPPVPALRPGAPAGDDFATVTARSDAARAFERRAAAYPFKISQACTPEYASPEQCVHIEFADGADCEPRQLDGRADLYSFGVIAYQLLTGRLPFQKPAHRFQYLELHQRARPEPWGASESQVPKRLRQFVERCLEKDPDGRWADAQEAHEELERIARPAVPMRTWAAALALVLVGAWLAQFFASPPVTSAVLSPAAGHLSPGAPSFSCQLMDSESDAPLELAGEVRLLDGAGEDLRGWSVELSADRGGLRIAPDTDWMSRHPGRVVLDDLKLLDPLGSWTVPTSLHLVWLGERTWDHEIRVGGQDVEFTVQPGPLSEHAPVDPNGLEFELRFPHLEPGDLSLDQSAFQSLARGVTLSEQTDLDSGPGLGVTFRLDVLEDGARHLQLDLANSAGARRTIELPVTLRAAGPEFTIQYRLSAGADQPWSRDEPWADGRPLILEAGDAVSLVLESTRQVTLTCVKLGNVNEVLVPGRSRVFDLAPLLEGVAAGETADCALVVRDDVRCSKRRARFHEEIVELQIQVIEDKKVDVRLQALGRQGPGASRAPDGAPPTFGPDDTLSLHVETSYPLGWFDLELDLFDAEGVHVERAQVALITPQENVSRVPEQVDPLRLSLPDGAYVLRAEARRHNEQGTSMDRPEFPFQLDSLKPAVVLDPELATPLVVTEGSQPFSLSIPIPDEEVGTVLEFRVLRAGQVRKGWRQAAPQRTESGSGLCWIVEPDGSLTDGLYQLELRAEDRGGNTQELPALELEVAREGPELQLSSPKLWSGPGSAFWNPAGDESGGLVPVRVAADDPNGVGGLRCFVFRSEEAPARAEVLDARLLETAVELALEPDRLDEWRWAFRPPESWSEAEDVFLHLIAADDRGATSYRTEGPFLLPLIDPVLPPAYEGMPLIAVDSRAEYVFRGRTFEEENVCFIEAGLSGLWVEWGMAKPGLSDAPWAVRVPARGLRSFYLEPREVSVGEFLEFLQDARGYQDNAHWQLWARPDLVRRDALARELERRAPGAAVTGVRFAEAHAYATYRGRRLPSVLELEFATRGGTRYQALCADGSREGIAAGGPALRGLSRGAEWTASPATWRAAEGAPPGPWRGPGASFELFLPLARESLFLAEEIWIQGSLVGAVPRDEEDLRRDFAAVDAAPARLWTDERVGFRCALDARTAIERRPRPTAKEDSR